MLAKMKAEHRKIAILRLDVNASEAECSVQDGGGTMETGSGVLEGAKFGVGSRMGEDPGTNPEELIGAAHAGCFTMALSLILGEAGLTAERMETTAEVTLDKVDDGYAITNADLDGCAKPRIGSALIEAAAVDGEAHAAEEGDPAVYAQMVGDVELDEAGIVVGLRVGNAGG